VGQAIPSSEAPSATDGQNATFSGYTGFIGDEGVDAATPSLASSLEPARAGFVRHVQQEMPNILSEEDAPLEIAESQVDAHYCGCDDKGCSGSCGVSFGPIFYDPWVTFEYMHAWARGRGLPPLVTTSPPGFNGLLPTAGVLFGDEYVGSALQASGRVSFGGWLDEERSVGLGGRFFGLEGDSTRYAAASDGAGNPLLARPFYNTDPGVNAADSLVVSAVALRTGSVLAAADNEVLSADVYIRNAVLRATDRRVDLLVGYHLTRVDDSLSIYNRMTQIGGVIPAGTVFEFEDLFDVHNEFHGAELGLQSEFDRGPFTLSMLGKLSMGNMRQTLTISGRSSRTPPGGPTTNFTGGLLALGDNLGTYSQNQFSIIPEAEFKVICRITERLEASIGYSLVYWSDVALAGQQIDMSSGQPTVNFRQALGGTLVGPSNPVFTGFRDTDFWVQGLSIGFTLKH